MRVAGVVAAAATVAVLWGTGPTPAQSAGCDGLNGKRVTMSGVLDKIEEFEVMIYLVVFTDTRTGCRVVLMETELDLPESCKPGRGVVATGILKRSGFGHGLYDLDRGNSPAPGTLSCR